MKKKNNVEVLANTPMVDPKRVMGVETTKINIIFHLGKDSRYQ